MAVSCRTAVALFALLCTSLAGCGDSSDGVGTPDGGSADASMDSGLRDAGIDARVDASDAALAAPDGGQDSGAAITTGIACTSVSGLEAGESMVAAECGSGLCGGVVCAALGTVSVCLGEPCGGGCDPADSCVGFMSPASNRCVPTDVCSLQE